MVSDKATRKENYANAEKGGSGGEGGSHSESKETKGLWRESRSSFGPGPAVRGAEMASFPSTINRKNLSTQRIRHLSA